MANPFYINELPVDAPFCDREDDLRRLVSYAEAHVAVVLHSPRRYGKTSLVRRVQHELDERGAITFYADFFGVASVEDVAGRLAKAVFARTHGRPGRWRRALAGLGAFRPVLRPDPQGGVSLSVEPSLRPRRPLELLERTLSDLETFAAGEQEPVHIALDEFQEIVALRDAPALEAAMRSSLQRLRAGWLFAGSRRRVLLGIFSERQRPFFQSAIIHPLRPLPQDDLARYLVDRFAAGGVECGLPDAQRLARMSGGHPGYAQRLGFFAHEAAAPGATIVPAAMARAHELLMQTEAPLCEAVIAGLPPQQRQLLRALAREPASQLLAGAFLRAHGLGSVGGVQHAARQLELHDLIQRDPDDGVWRVVDPILAIWLREQDQEHLDAAPEGEP